MTETYYTVRAESTCLKNNIELRYVREFDTPGEAAAFVDERRKCCRGWEFHIDAHERVKKPTFRF